MPLPTVIPPSNVPVLLPNGTFNPQWYLFLYNMGQQTLGSGGGVAASEVDQIDMIDLDASGSDSLQAYRAALNALLLQPDLDASPSLRDLANALMLALDHPPQDPAPRAQPAQSITPSGSPFTYAALSDGAVAVSGGTVSDVSIVRSGVTLPSGAIAGLFPVRRMDSVQVTYTVAPTMNFLPS